MNPLKEEKPEKLIVEGTPDITEEVNAGEEYTDYEKEELVKYEQFLRTQQGQMMIQSARNKKAARKNKKEKDKKASRRKRKVSNKSKKINRRK